MLRAPGVAGGRFHAPSTEMAMKNVPSWAKVPKEAYRELRDDLKRTCDVYGFEFSGVWDVMVTRMESRHQRVLSGKVKRDITLAEAVEFTQTAVRKEHALQEEEKSVADQITKLMKAMK